MRTPNHLSIHKQQREVLNRPSMCKKLNTRQSLRLESNYERQNKKSNLPSVQDLGNQPTLTHTPTRQITKKSVCANKGLIIGRRILRIHGISRVLSELSMASITIKNAQQRASSPQSFTYFSLSHVCASQRSDIKSLYGQITFKRKRGPQKRLPITCETVALKNSAAFSSNFPGTIPYCRQQKYEAPQLSTQEHFVSHFRMIMLKHCETTLVATNFGLRFAASSLGEILSSRIWLQLKTISAQRSSSKCKN